MALEAEERRIKKPLNSEAVLVSHSPPPAFPLSHSAAPSAKLCAFGTETWTPTPDRHEHGKQNRPLVVDHVGDLEKVKEERDGGGRAQGPRHLGVWGEASVLSGPLATLVPPQTGKGAAGGQHAGGGWTLGLVRGKLI